MPPHTIGCFVWNTISCVLSVSGLYIKLYKGDLFRVFYRCILYFTEEMIMRKIRKICCVWLAVAAVLCLSGGIAATGVMPGTGSATSGSASNDVAGGVGGDDLFNEGDLPAGDGMADENLTSGEGGDTVDHGTAGAETDGGDSLTGDGAGDGMIDNDTGAGIDNDSTLGDVGGDTQTDMPENTSNETGGSAAWWIALLVAIALIVLLCVLVPRRKRE